MNHAGLKLNPAFIKRNIENIEIFTDQLNELLKNLINNLKNEISLTILVPILIRILIGTIELNMLVIELLKILE